MNQPFSVALQNGATKNMNVDGSSVNKLFSATASQTILISQFTVVMSLPNTSVLTGFGTSASALTNGLLFQIQSAGATGNVAVVKTNGDLALMFGPGQAGSSAFTGLGNTPAGFGGSLDLFYGVFYLPGNSPSIIESGDIVGVTVRDNLTALTYLSIGIQGVQVL